MRPATTTHQLGIRPRGGNSSSTTTTRDSWGKDSNCHLPPQTSTPTPTTPPTVPTAGSHDPRSSHSANVSSSNLKINDPTATTNNNSYDQPRSTTIPEVAALVATGAINTASRAGLLHQGHSGTCALHPFFPPPLMSTHKIALCYTRVSKTPPANPPTCDSSEVPPPVQPPARQQTFPQQSQQQEQRQRQLLPPSAHARHDSRDSISGRPTSSVYSQPSPLHTTFAPQRDRPNVSRHQPDGFDDVSPPSSPELLSPGNVYV